MSPRKILPSLRAWRRRHALRTALARLDDTDRQVYWLIAVEERTLLEASTQLGVSTSDVEHALARALRALADSDLIL